MNSNTLFSGSYSLDDVIFLLKPVDYVYTAVEEKERLIQSGERHYSEMLSREEVPDEKYMNLFRSAFDRNRQRFAKDIARLAINIEDRYENPVLVSLARAGTPVGVLLHRALKAMGRDSTHYSISIIRGRGIDELALHYILDRHEDRNIIFVDGWTGKGAINSELRKSVLRFNSAHGTHIDPGMVVVADLAGVAKLAATDEDYLIPSSVLNGIISGLVSRSILNDELIGPDDFHACVFYEHLREHDLSGQFVDSMTGPLLEALGTETAAIWDTEHRRRLQDVSGLFVTAMMVRYRVDDSNRIKPGIGESTRSLLRRVPERLLLQGKDEVVTEDLQHLVGLARDRNVPIEFLPDLPYRAAVIIKKIS